MNAVAEDRELQRHTVQAAITAARIRAHDRFCSICRQLEDPARRPCGRRDQLQRQLEARRALVNARQRVLSRG